MTRDKSQEDRRIKKVNREDVLAKKKKWTDITWKDVLKSYLKGPRESQAPGSKIVGLVNFGGHYNTWHLANNAIQREQPNRAIIPENTFSTAAKFNGWYVMKNFC